MTTTQAQLDSVPHAAEGFEKVASWKVTAAMLRGWGFAVRETEKVMGTTVVVREGLDLNLAKHLASQTGWTFTAFATDEEREELRKASAKSTTVDLVALAWFESVRRA